MGLDYKEFKSFTRKFTKMANDFDAFIKDFLLQNALDCLAKTKRRTPVDTGHLRRGWALGNVIKNGNIIEIHIYNHSEYATYLEYGHTTRDRKNWVEGYFMATVSLSEIENKIPRRFEKEFINFMSRINV